MVRHWGIKHEHKNENLISGIISQLPSSGHDAEILTSETVLEDLPVGQFLQRCFGISLLQ